MSDRAGRQAERQQRRSTQSSPYSRRSSHGPSTNDAAEQATPRTPSRIGSLLSSLWSPFRSNKQREPRQDVLLIQDDDEDDEAQHAEQDTMMSTDDDDRARPHSARQLEDAPPSPARSAASTTTATSDWQRAPPSHSPARATEQLARFFAERSQKSDEPLSAVEQAGVFQLLQQAKGGSQSPALPGLPTAFSPSFHSRVAPSPSMPNLFSPAPSSPRMPSSNSLFSVSSAAAPASGTPFRRKRPVYVGAGYSSQSARRRRVIPPATTTRGSSELSRSQSEGTIADGKRRRLDYGATEDAAPPVSGSEMVASSSNALTRSQTSTSLYTQSAPASTSKSSIVSRSAAGRTAATPARPSPLWQVSKADTPSPSPPTVKTMTADLVMSLIKETPSPTKQSTAKVQLENPYESFENNPIAQIAKSTAKAKPSSPRKSVVPLRRSARAKSPLASSLLESSSSSKSLSAIAAQPIDDLEMLERSMPPEIRAATAKASKKGKAGSFLAVEAEGDAKGEEEEGPTRKRATRARTRSPSPATVEPPKKSKPAADGKQKKAAPKADIVILSDSDEEEDENGQTSDAEAPVQAPQAEAPKPPPTFSSFTAASSAKTTAQAPAFSFGASASVSMPAFPSTAPKAAASASGAPTFSFGSSFSKPASQPQAVQATPIQAPVSNDVHKADDDEEKARQAALAVERTKLPMFSFESGEPIFGGQAKQDSDKDRGVKELVASMSRNELPSFVW